jgi:hypothetical protein
VEQGVPSNLLIQIMETRMHNKILNLNKSKMLGYWKDLMNPEFEKSPKSILYNKKQQVNSL